jgi:DHA1 family bicyclomycin/chloramphenicol resistance-like MFS transporter
VGIGIYLVGTCLAIFSESMWVLLLGRVLQGFGISGSKIGSRALIRDLFAGDQMARIMSVIMMLFIFVPMLAPFLGQTIMLEFGWRAIFVGFLMFALVVSLWFGLRQPETLTVEKRIPLSLTNILISTKKILKHQKVMAYMLVTGITFGAMLVYLSTSQAMFSDFYGIEEDFPLYFAMLAAGVGLAAVVNSKIVVRYGMHKVSTWSLQGMTAAATALLLAGITSNGVPPFWVYMAGFFVILFCMGFIFGNINALVMEWLGGMAGLGNSIVGSLSSLVAVIVAIVAGRFYTDNIYPVALTFMIVAAISLYLLFFARRAPGEAL